MFLSVETLRGNKRDVYLILKILKLCTGAEVTSFKMKFAVERALWDDKKGDKPLVTSLQRVLRYWTLKERFSEVHPELRNVGVKRVEVTEKGLLFIKK